MEVGKAVRYLKLAKRAGFSSVHLTGGEPLLHPDLPAVIGSAFRLNFQSLTINTSTFVPRFQEKVRSMAQAGFTDGTIFTVTLNGFDEIHNQSRGVRSAKIVRKNIKILIEMGQSVYLYTVVFPELVSRLPEFIDEIYRSFPGIRGIRLIQPHRTRSESYGQSKSMLSADSFIFASRLAGVYRSMGRDVGFLENPLANAVSSISDLPPDSSLDRNRRGRMTVFVDDSIALYHSDDENRFRTDSINLKQAMRKLKSRNRNGDQNHECESCKHFSLCRKNGITEPTAADRDPGGEKKFCIEVLDRISGESARAGSRIP